MGLFTGNRKSHWNLNSLIKLTTSTFFNHTRQSSKRRTLKTKLYRFVNQCLTPEEASAVCTITEVFKLQVSLFKKNS